MNFMTYEELYNLIENKQPNICQVVAYKDNKKYILIVGMGTNKMTVFI